MGSSDWLLQFKAPEELFSVPEERRAEETRQLFQRLMQHIAPLLQDMDVVAEHELMLSATVCGEDEQCRRLGRYLVDQSLGELVPNSRVGIAATHSPHDP